MIFHHQRTTAVRPRRVCCLGAFLGFLLIAAFVPLRAATLTDGFGPLALAKGERPVPGGCGRPLQACTCCAQAANADPATKSMNVSMDMSMSMDMGDAVISSNVRLNAVGTNASPGMLTVTNVGASAYSINGVNDPVLTFVRGQTYTFSVTASGHPFYIKTVQGNGTGNAYANGVNGNGTQTGTVTFTVPLDAPDTLFYDCAIHAAMTNRIDVVNAIPEPSTWALLGLMAAGAGVAARRQRRRGSRP